MEARSRITRPSAKTFALLAALALVLLVAAGPARADTLVDTFGAADSYSPTSGQGVGCIPWVWYYPWPGCLAEMEKAMNFTVTDVGTDYYLNSIAVPVANMWDEVGDGSAIDVEVAIAEDNAGMPGAILDAATITSSPASQVLTATFSGAVMLTRGTTYWVEMNWVTPGTLVAWWNTPNTGLMGDYAVSSDAGASWYTDTDYSTAFRVTGTAVTPPGEAMVDLSTGGEDTVLYGGAAGDELSRDRNVAVGDVNGDGIKDLIVGAPQAEGPSARSNCGAVYVYYGLRALPEALDVTGASGPDPDVTIYGASAGDRLSLGGALAVGDVTGDGIDDLVIGAQYADGPSDGRADAGEAYLIAGSGALPYSVDLANAEEDMVIHGATAGDALTREGALAVGDVTGDGIADVILGAPDADGPSDGRGGCGEVYVLAGSGALPYSADLAACEYDAIIYGAGAGDALSEDGALILGDLTADGILDIVAGTPLGDGSADTAADAGEAYVIAGSGAVPYTLDLSTGSPASAIYGAGAGDGLTTGRAMAVGDFNGDGKDDLVLGAPFADGNGASAGEAYVIYGSTTLSSSFDLALADEDVTIDGAEAGDELCGGGAVAAGDVNNDGLDEILLGAPKADGPANARPGAGEAYIVYGSTTLAASLDFSAGDEDVILYGATAGDDLTGGGGIRVGDFNGDGLSDLLLAAPQADGPGDARLAAGEAYIFYGSASLAASLDIFNGDQDVIIFGASSGDSLGYTGTLAAGDINDDGVDDAILGAYLADGPSEGRAGAGEVYAVFGTPPPTTATVKQTDHAGNALVEDYGTSRVKVDFGSGDNASTTTAVLTRNDLNSNFNKGETAEVQWRITTDRANASATLTFHYLENEAADQNENNLEVYRADNPLGTWYPLATTVDTAKNTATVTGATSFGYFMLREDPFAGACFIGAAGDHRRRNR